jgi:hypothetical protein
MEGVVVDTDEDLVALCSRMQASKSRHCAILFCEEREVSDDTAPASSHSFRPPAPPRAYH